MIILTQCMVSESAGLYANNMIMMLRTIICFIGLYYHPVSSLLIVLITQIVAKVLCQLIYIQYTIPNAIGDFILNMLVLIAALLACHIILTFAGNMFAESENQCEI